MAFEPRPAVVTLARQFVCAVLASRAVLPRLRRRLLHHRATVLMYHELAEDRDDIDAWTVVRKSDFLRQVDYLRQHYEIGTLDDVLQRLQSGARFARPPAVLTFDDGAAGNHDVLLPIVEALALPVTIFVATGQVLDQRLYWFDRLINALQGTRRHVLELTAHGLGRYLINERKGAGKWVEIQRLLTDLKALAPDRREDATDRVVAGIAQDGPAHGYQIRALRVAQVTALAASRWVTIGAHSHCHNLLTQLSDVAAEASVRRSRELLRDWTGRAVDHFAYPSGAYSAALMRTIERLGFASAVTTEETLWGAQHPRYCIPRIGIGRFDSLESFKVQLLGGARAAVSGFAAQA